MTYRLADVRGLTDYWQARTQHAPATSEQWMTDRMLLDTLGLGLEQTLGFLAGGPGLAEFLEWIEATAGLPDPGRVARYLAALDGAPPPAQTAARLREVELAEAVLDADDLAHWEREGFVIVREAITGDQAAAAAELLWEEVGARPEDPESWYGARTNGLMVQRFQHPSLEAARRSMRVHKAFAQLWETSDLWMTIDRMSFNAPEREGHAFAAPRLHWDVSLARPIPFATQGILYLTDTREDQGALELVPGFHHRIEDWLDGLGEADPRQVDLSTEAVRVAGGAGDLVIWRQDLPHGASPNRTERPRLAQYVNMYSPRLRTHSQWR